MSEQGVVQPGERLSWQWGVLLNPPETLEHEGGSLIIDWDSDVFLGVTQWYDCTLKEAMEVMAVVCDTLDRDEKGEISDEWVYIGRTRSEAAADAATELLEICGRVPDDVRFALVTRADHDTTRAEEVQ